VLADGTLHTAVDVQQVQQQAKALLAAGCEAVCLRYLACMARL